MGPSKVVEDKGITTLVRYFVSLSLAYFIPYFVSLIFLPLLPNLISLPHPLPLSFTSILYLVSLLLLSTSFPRHYPIPLYPM